MKLFLMWTGGVFWIVVLVLFAAFVVYPAIVAAGESLSLTRFLWRCTTRYRPIPHMETVKAFFRYWWRFLYEGSDPEYTMEDGSWWKGIGKWELKPVRIEQPEPENAAEERLSTIHPQGEPDNELAPRS